MDLDEWESLSDDCYLDFNEDGEKKILGSSESVIDMDYFYPSSPPPRKSRVHNQLVPLPIQLEPKIGNTPDEFLVKDIKKNQSFATPSSSEKIKDLKVGVGAALEDDHEETVSKVFFKKKENEFVDMKIESPKSSSSSKGLWPPMDEIITSPRRKIEKDVFGNKEEESAWDEEKNSGFNLWKWSLTGVGAICTFGVAAASICVLFFGSQQRKKLDHKIRFQIYADDKRIKQVVQHATKLNEAISAVRGVPMSRAQITVGGYYDGL